MMPRIAASLLSLSLVFPFPLRAAGSVSPADAEQIALETHPSVRLAGEEAALAELKKDEAHRAMWPAVTLKGERTDGFALPELGTPGFREISYGVQASQPVIQGGKLYRTYRQSKAAWESAVAKMEKARQEVRFSARESTWNYVKSVRSRAAYQRAFEDLSKEKTMADKLSEQGVIPRQVHMAVTAQYNQARLALDGADAELTARVWQWTAALGLNEPPEFRPDETIPAPARTDLALDDCLKRADAKHPDIIVQAASTEAALQGQKGGKSLYLPKFSANGFYGRSGGNFNSEPLEIREDWQVGLQLSQYFGANTANVSGFHQKTSPKIGQTSRTESRTVSGSIGILDALKQKTERREAIYGYEQAVVQMDRTRMDVANNVREAYANWRKALATLSSAENDLELAKSDHAIAKVKSAHREVPLSERAMSRNKLAQAEAAHADAQAGYNIAAAALCRAVGDPDLFNPSRGNP
jgi:outer membrane protein TolC